jgi:hypothetical protein
MPTHSGNALVAVSPWDSSTSHAWAIKHGECRLSAVSHEYAPLPENATLGTPAAIFQARHACSILVTRSTSSLLVSPHSACPNYSNTQMTKPTRLVMRTS